MTASLVALDAAREALDGLPDVVATDLILEDDRLDDSILEIVVGPEYERVPPRVCRVLAANDCGLWDVSTQGDPRHFVVVAR